jgi:hypothetical protein
VIILIFDDCRDSIKKINKNQNNHSTHFLFILVMSLDRQDFDGFVFFINGIGETVLFVYSS